ncbi:MAG: PepSY domain-containing protein [Clostridia bacterium]|nr:PepSY domain-containing protein [Clostridia bacterium]
MKKQVGFLTAAALSCTLVCGSLIAFSDVQEAYQVTASTAPQFIIEVDSNDVTFFDVSGNEVQPIVYNGTTYLPVRAIGELMDKNVNWDQSSLTVTIAGDRAVDTVTGTEDTDAEEETVTVQIRPDFTIIVDGIKQKFTDVNGNAVYAMLYNGSTYLPLRAIGKLMGKNVLWDSDTKTISLYGTVSAQDPLVTDADSFNSTAVTPQSPPDNNNGFSLGNTGKDEAKRKALEHAGLTDAENIRLKPEHDDGRKVYEIEFSKDGIKYEYKIDADTGEIISDSRDKQQKPNAAAQQGEYISEKKAKSIALAAVNGAAETNIVKCVLDRDDEQSCYEVKIILGKTEYDFEIDAYTGEILEHESELIDD